MSVITPIGHGRSPLVTEECNRARERNLGYRVTRALRPLPWHPTVAHSIKGGRSAELFIAFKRKSDFAGHRPCRCGASGAAGNRKTAVSGDGDRGEIERGWSRDVSEEVAREVLVRVVKRDDPLAASSRQFVQTYVDADELLRAEHGFA
jgi:hypothetical protein